MTSNSLQLQHADPRIQLLPTMSTMAIAVFTELKL